MNILTNFFKLQANRLLEIIISLVKKNFILLTFLLKIIIFNLNLLSLNRIKSIIIS